MNTAEEFYNNSILTYSEIKQEELIIEADNIENALTDTTNISASFEYKNTNENRNESEINVDIEKEQINIEISPIYCESRVNNLQNDRSLGSDVIQEHYFNLIPTNRTSLEIENNNPPTYNPISNSSYVNNIESTKKVCYLCKLNFRSNFEFDLHIINNINTHQKCIKIPYKCTNCSKVLLSVQEFILHLQWHLNIILSCKKCNLYFPCHQAVIEHELYCHNMPSYYKCPHCVNTFYSRESYLDHLNAHISLFQRNQPVQNEIRLNYVSNHTINKQIVNTSVSDQIRYIPNYEPQPRNLLFHRDYINNTREYVSEQIFPDDINPSRMSFNMESNYNNQQPVTFHNNYATSILTGEPMRQNTAAEYVINNIELGSKTSSTCNLSNQQRSSNSGTNSLRTEVGNTNKFTGKFSIRELLGVEKHKNTLITVDHPSRATTNACKQNNVTNDHIDKELCNQQKTHHRNELKKCSSAYVNNGEVSNDLNNVTLQINQSVRNNHVIKHQQETSQNKKETKQEYLCHICGKFMFYQKSFFGHIYSHEVNLLLTCQICHVKCKNEDSLANHVKNHIIIKQGKKLKSLTTIEKSQNCSKNATNEYSCNICKQEFRTFFFLQTHVLVEHTKYTCKYCKRCFVSSTELSLHLLMLHEDHLYQCDISFKKFETEERMICHKTLHTKNNYQCYLCQTNFIFQNQLYSHLISHMAEKYFYSCIACDKIYNSILEYIKHMYSHTVDNLHTKFQNMKIRDHCQLVCTICFEKFENIEQLKTHRLKHPTKIQILKKYLLKTSCKSKQDKIILKESKLQILHSHLQDFDSPNLIRKNSIHSKNMSFWSLRNIPTLKVQSDLILQKEEISCNNTTDNKSTTIILCNNPTEPILQKNTSVAENYTTLRNKNKVRKLKFKYAAYKESYTCSYCNMTIKNVGILKRHVAWHKNGGKNGCGVCQQSFKSTQWLNRHVQYLLCCTSQPGKKSKNETKVSGKPGRKKIQNPVLINSNAASGNTTEITNIENIVCVPDICLQNSNNLNNEKDSYDNQIYDQISSNQHAAERDSTAPSTSRAEETGDIVADDSESIKLECSYDEIDIPVKSPDNDHSLFQFTYEDNKIPVKSPVSDHRAYEYTYEEIDIPVKSPVSELNIKEMKFTYEEIEIPVQSPIAACHTEEVQLCEDFINKDITSASTSSNLPDLEHIKHIANCSLPQEVVRNTSNSNHRPYEQNVVPHPCFVKLERLDDTEQRKPPVSKNCIEKVQCDEEMINLNHGEINKTLKKRKTNFNCTVEEKKLKLHDTSNKFEYYMCPYCKLICTDITNFTTHVGISKKHKGISKYIIKSKSGSFVCTSCDLKLPNLLRYNSHIFTHQANENYPCKKCDSKFVYVCMLNRHQMCTKHKSDKQLWCSRCDIEFLNVFTMNEHEMTCHKLGEP